MVVLTLLLVLRLLVALKVKEGSRRLINMKYYLDRYHGKKSTVGWFRVYINIIHIMYTQVIHNDSEIGMMEYCIS